MLFYCYPRKSLLIGKVGIKLFILNQYLESNGIQKSSFQCLDNFF